MDNDNLSQMLLVISVAISQLISAYTIISDDIPTRWEERMEKQEGSVSLLPIQEKLICQIHKANLFPSTCNIFTSCK